MTDQPATPAPEPHATSNTPDSKWQRIIRWLREHDTRVTFLSAIVVLTTFIVKDEVRENLKDLVDSLSRAQELYVVRNDIRAVQSTVIGIEGSDDAKLSLDRLAALARERVFAEETLVDNTKNLLGTLPIETQITYRPALMKANQKLMLLDYRGGLLYKNLAHPVKNSEESARTEARNISFDAFEMDFDMYDLQDKIITEARKVREHDENIYSAVKITSRFLYIVSLGLVILGKVARLDSLVGGT